MNNPFVFGQVVSGEFFCDREEERRVLSRDLKDSQKLFLISPRRYGKTSLLKTVLKSLENEGFITVYIDLYRASSLQSFLELYCASIASASETILDKAVSFIKDVVPRLRPKITLSPDGTPSIGIEPIISERDVIGALDEVFDIPAHVAKRKNKKMAIVLDEFQEMANFNGEGLEKMLRSHVQNHDKVAYVFSGSKKHLLEDMVTKKERAFYKVGKIMYLEKIDRKIFSTFLSDKFISGNFEIEGDVIEKVLNVSDNIPYNVQFICHELWDEFVEVRKLTIRDVGWVLAKIVDEQTPFFIPQWDALSMNQRSLMKTVSNYGGKNLFTNEFLNISGIKAISTLQTSLRLLLKKGLLEKQNGDYVVADVFMKEWIRRNV
ncbi:MAG: hypothetical protein COS89_02485 [Deltaproteobacteria bacterium CG07_land_8_20_14_0_80_38_7]|nr:MAG: hypothetical protein COS89_02485 [Deltaproteobacteria bacterium CG07_land_8_20_14_0_80_38_7]